MVYPAQEDTLLTRFDLYRFLAALYRIVNHMANVHEDGLAAGVTVN